MQRDQVYIYPFVHYTVLIAAFSHVWGPLQQFSTKLLTRRRRFYRLTIVSNNKSIIEKKPL